MTGWQLLRRPDALWRLQPNSGPRKSGRLCRRPCLTLPVAVSPLKHFATACLRRGAHLRRLVRIAHPARCAKETTVEPHKQVAVAGNRCCFRIPPMTRSLPPTSHPRALRLALAAVPVAAGLPPVTTLDGAPGSHLHAPGRRKAGEPLGNPGKFFRDRFEDWVAVRLPDIGPLSGQRIILNDFRAGGSA